MKLAALALLTCVALSAQAPAQRPPYAKILDEAVRLENANQADAAIQLLKTEIAKEPAHALRLALADAYASAQRLDDAIATLQELLRDEPDQMDTLASLGQMHFDKGDRVRTAEFLRKAADVSPPNPNYLINLSIVTARVGRREFALMIDEELYRVYPDSSLIANNLAYSLADLNKDLDRALVLARMAYASQPDAVPVIDTLGWVYYKLGRLDDALPLLCRALAGEVEAQDLQGHVMKALDAMPKLNPTQLELRDWLRTDSDADPERDLRVRNLALQLAR